MTPTNRPPNNPNRRGPGQPSSAPAPAAKPPGFDELFPLATSMRMKLKVFLYGDVGTRKTPTALTFPRPLMLDVDGGSRAYAHRYPDMRIFQPRTLADIMKAVQVIRADGGRSCDTVIIDSITPIITDLKARYLEGSKTGYLSQADYSRVNLKLADLYSALMDLPTHVVVIARLQDTFESTGNGFKKSGDKFAADRSAPYNFDIVVRMLGDGKATIERIRGLEIPASVNDLSWDSFFADVAAKLDNGDDPQDVRTMLGGALFTAYWRMQGLSNDEIKAALGGGLSQWDKGRAEADSKMAAYLESNPRQKAQAWTFEQIKAEADRLGWIESDQPLFNHEKHLKNTLALLLREKRITNRTPFEDVIAALQEYAQNEDDSGPGFSSPI